jgi:hypothetical protein
MLRCYGEHHVVVVNVCNPPSLRLSASTQHRHNVLTYHDVRAQKSLGQHFSFGHESLWVSACCSSIFLLSRANSLRQKAQMDISFFAFTGVPFA